MAGGGESSGNGGIASGGTPGEAGGGGSAAGGSAAGGSAAGGSAAGGTPANGGESNAGASGSVTGQAGSGAGSGGTPGGGGAGSAGTGGSTTGTPGVRIVGRTVAGANGSARFSWPGVNIHARFTGTQVSMDLNDGSNRNRFTVVIDGGAPNTVTTAPGQASLSLATGLTNGMHNLVIWRNTEAPSGVSEFVGLSSFGAGGALLAPAAAPDRRIEVIGDSLSAGAGVEGTATACSPNIDAFTNNYQAYGSVAARAVSADGGTIAWSGIGVYRNYSPGSPTMPARYGVAAPSDAELWDFTKYQPHVVVINLGTNDFGNNMNPGQPYVDAYVAFAKTVRSKYANANMILIDMYGGERVTAINSVITALRADGETKAEMLSFSAVPNNNTGCNSHPNTVAQQAMGNLLAARLRTLMSW